MAHMDAFFAINHGGMFWAAAPISSDLPVFLLFRQRYTGPSVVKPIGWGTVPRSSQEDRS